MENEAQLMMLFEGVLMGDGDMHLRDGADIYDVYKYSVADQLVKLYEIRKNDPEMAEYMCNTLVQECINEMKRELEE